VGRGAEGLGPEMAPLCAVLDELAQHDASTAAAVLINAFGFEFLQSCGANEVIERIQGRTQDQLLLTSPVFGGSEFNLTGDGALSGRQRHLPLSKSASLIIIPLSKIGGTGFALVETSRLDFKAVTTLGLRELHFADFSATGVKFESVEGASIVHWLKVQRKFGLAVAAVLTGIMDGALKDAKTYAESRVQGGRVIALWPEVKRTLGSLELKLKTCKELVTGVADRESRASDFETAAVAAGVHARETAPEFVSRCLQIFGGAGYIKNFGIEKRYRDVFQVASMLQSSSFETELDAYK
jgi:alkylation response protein AidB-like acyl-CoA dehydrogenase